MVGEVTLTSGTDGVAVKAGEGVSVGNGDVAVGALSVKACAVIVAARSDGLTCPPPGRLQARAAINKTLKAKYIRLAFIVLSPHD